MVFGLPQVHRLIFLRVYLREYTGVKYVQLQIYTQYSMDEHLIPVSSFLHFFKDAFAHIKDSVNHYRELIKNVQKITSGTKNAVESSKVTEVLKKQFDLCEVPEGENISYFEMPEGGS